MYRALIVGGTIDHNGGKASGIVRVLAERTGWPCINGGAFSALREIDFKQYEALVWMPNIDNAEEKILPLIKKTNPVLTLISSKRVVEKDYTVFDVITRMFASRSNLGIMIGKEGPKYVFRLLDPLGNQFCETDSVETLAQTLRKRVDIIRSLTRVASETLGDLPDQKPVPNEDFIGLVREMGDEFSRHVNAFNPKRFLGNASARDTDRITRCCHGFPAFREAGMYLVSRRDVDKTTMSAQDFVPILPDEKKVRYYGSQKPSVDAPIQIRLLNFYDKVNYIVHGHVYIDGAPVTQSRIPCGHIEEFDEIRDLFPSRDAHNFSVNLKGHGCLLLASDIGYLRAQKGHLASRPFPEP